MEGGLPRRCVGRGGWKGSNDVRLHIGARTGRQASYPGLPQAVAASAPWSLGVGRGRLLRMAVNPGLASLMDAETRDPCTHLCTFEGGASGLAKLNPLRHIYLRTLISKQGPRQTTASGPPGQLPRRPPSREWATRHWTATMRARCLLYWAWRHSHCNSSSASCSFRRPRSLRRHRPALCRKQRSSLFRQLLPMASAAFPRRQGRRLARVLRAG